MSKESIIEVHDLAVAYDNKPVLWNIDFSINEAGLIGIVGPNGAGKSTLLKSMMGLLDVASGYVKFYGLDLEQSRDKIAYVPQRESVDWDFPTTVKEVVMMGRYPKMNFWKRASKKDKEIVAACIEKVGLTGFENRQISQLSGGQQQRTFIARALAQEADVYLMDEPFAGVDAATEKTILALLKDLVDAGKCIVVVHHDLHAVAGYFDQVILLNMRLIAFGPKQEVLTADNLQEAYGGKLTILSEVSELIKRGGYPTQDAHAKKQ